MEETLMRIWENLIGRTDGPLTLRLFLQPTMATLLAIRAGLKDAREGQPPYLWTIFTNPTHRRDLLQQGWKDVGKVFVMATILDAIYQFITVRWFYPLETLITATVLALLPYLLLRGLVTRFLRVSGVRVERS